MTTATTPQISLKTYQHDDRKALDATPDSRENGLLQSLDIPLLVNNGLEPPDEINRRLLQIGKVRNTLLEAAKPLLLALAQLPRQKFSHSDQISVFRTLLEHEVVVFTQLCTRANVRREHVVAASYALCTALDEFANHTEWGGGKDGAGVWSTQMLAAQFHHDTHGGENVFLLIGRLATNPKEHLHLLEIMLHILTLGFVGQYSNRQNGQRDVDAIRAHLYALVSAERGPVPLGLSPNWKGEPAGKLSALWNIPVWVTASVLGVAALGLFSWYKYQLVVQTNALAAQIVEIGNRMSPPAPVAASLRLAELLKDDIAQGRVKVDEDAERSAVTFKGDELFVPGQAIVSGKILPLLDKVAAQIAKVPGSVQVIGHTDNVPIKTKKFPNNQVLSEERAASVADILQARGVAASRLNIVGRGDSAPVAGNTTPAQRAQNRRVEIVVTQSDGATIPSSISASIGAAR